MKLIVTLSFWLVLAGALRADLLVERTEGPVTPAEDRPRSRVHARLVPELWPAASKAGLKQAKSDPLLTAEILVMKYYRNIGRFPASGESNPK
jgi:hypothetical protein